MLLFLSCFSNWYIFCFNIETIKLIGDKNKIYKRNIPHIKDPLCVAAIMDNKVPMVPSLFPNPHLDFDKQACIGQACIGIARARHCPKVLEWLQSGDCP